MAEFLQTQSGRRQDMVKIPLLEILTLVSGLNRRALATKGWVQFHQSGKEFVKMKMILDSIATGNSGRADDTVSNVAPWQITVGASTMDREFPSYVVLGNNKSFKGQSLWAKGLPGGKFFPIISGANALAANATTESAQLCEDGTLDCKKVKGKILVCLRGENARVDKGEQAALAGAVGMVLANSEENGNEIIADPHVLYLLHISTSLVVLVYLVTSIQRSKMTNIPRISSASAEIHGVTVIAAYIEAESPTSEDFDNHQIPSVLHQELQCSGFVSLLKTLHPDWGPAAIKSAIMNTAAILDNSKETILNASYFVATPFSYGAGHVQPNLAMDPGLVYDLTVKDYLDFLCALKYNKTQISLFSENTYTCPKDVSLTNFNYPSITVPKLTVSITVMRTVKSVGSPGTYRARVKKLKGISVSVAPKSLTFMKIGEEKSFKITIKVNLANTVTKDCIWRVDMVG